MSDPKTPTDSTEQAELAEKMFSENPNKKNKI